MREKGKNVKKWIEGIGKIEGLCLRHTDDMLVMEEVQVCVSHRRYTMGKEKRREDYNLSMKQEM